MADCITALITQNIVTSISAVTTVNEYNTNVAYCEQERIVERKNDRYPIVEVAGPAMDINSENHTQGSEYDLEYSLFYQELINDDSLSDEPATRQADNVIADLIKGLMADVTRGGYAITTKPISGFYAIDETNDGLPIFMVVLTITVKTIIDSFDPYELG